uniref:ABC transporter domain-containing protein n=1 Tax=Puya raimondii TaxID=112807 RepID=A0A8A0WJ73_PUYRA|nr:hypothetical protein PY_004897 [Puya raimondii]
MDDLCFDLSTTSDSPHDSTSPSSSFYHSSPPPSVASTLAVANLSYTVRRRPQFNILSPSTYFSPRKTEPTHLLKSATFTARSSEILAIVGPSGAGKSTLLRIISGRVKPSKFDRHSVTLNDRPITRPAELRRLCGFVTQEDNLLPLLTVKETLMFSAKFRLRGASSREREERVTALMQELGLEHVAQSYVGDEENRGISGGERKRVSIAVDVIHDPPILLLDEPTSGLDSRSALQVVELLASMARARRQILILTIHQPSYRMLRYVSTFLLLLRGTVAHCGSLRSLEDTIARMGLKIPAQLNPLEYAMEIIDQLEEYNAKYPKLIKHQELHQSEDSIVEEEEEEEEEAEGELEHEASRDYYCCSRSEEVVSLSSRFAKIMYRTKQLFLARTMQAIVGGLGLGSVYLRLKMSPNGATERLGLFAFSLSFLLSSTVEALPIFLQEQRVLMRESSRRMYRISSYMIANTLVFLPFLLAVAILFAIPIYWLVGLNPTLSAFAFFVFVVWLIVLMASSLVLFLSAISRDFMLGNSLICIFLGVFFLFSGYFLPKESIPKYWLFMYYVSLYRYPLDTLLINEYGGSMRGKCFYWQDEDRSICALTGADVLKARGLHGGTRWVNVGIMCGFFLLYRLLCWILLLRRASKTTL